MRFATSELQESGVLDIVLPEGRVLGLHDAVVQHLEVGEDDVRRVGYDYAGVLDDAILGHHLAEGFLVGSLADEESGRDLPSQAVVLIDGLREAFRLVGRQGVHRVEDDDLDALLADVPVTVVKDGVEETLGLTRSGTRGDEGVLGEMSFLRGQLLEGLDLMLVGRESGFYLKWDPESLGCRDERRLKGDVRTLEETVLRILDEIIECLLDVRLLEAVGGPDELQDGTLYFVCLLER